MSDLIPAITPQAILDAIERVENPFRCYAPVDCRDIPAVDWVKMRDTIGAEAWRTYVALRHALKRALCAR